MENYTYDSGSHNQFCPVNRVRVWKKESIPESVRLNIIACVLVHCITSPFITVANFLVCWSIFKNKTLRKNNCKLLLAFLALTDFLTGAVAQPLTIARHICHLKPKCDPCIPDALMGFFVITLQSVSYFQLVLISAERYLAIQHALRYNVLVTSKKLMCAVAVLWLMSLLFSVLYFIVFIPFNVPLALVGVPLTTVLCIFVIYCNICVLIESKRHHRAIAAQAITLALTKKTAHNLCPSSVSNNAPRSAEFKAGKTTALIVGVFFLPFIFSIVILIHVNIFKDSLPAMSLHITLQWTVTLVQLTSLLNPLVYCWRMSEIRRVCYDYIRKIFCKNG